MQKEYSNLIVPFSEFENKCQLAIENGRKLLHFSNEKETVSEFVELQRQWVLDTTKMFELSFEDKTTYFVREFKQIGKGGLLPNPHPEYYKTYEIKKHEIVAKIHILQSTLNIVTVCDYFRLENAHIALKSNLSTLEKANILLEKLYLLGSEEYHLARMILIGSGVILKTPSEANQLATYLKERGLIEESHHASNSDVFVSITMNGKIEYEESSRMQKIEIMKSNKELSSVFIVHGHNNEMKESVARVIEKIGLRAIILHEMPNHGKTIIEKFTDNSEVEYAIVLLSADDLGYSKTTGKDSAKSRPRQNVVFELGYFIGKLGRKHVFVLYESLEDFDLHSDFSGVVLVEFDKNGAWKMSLGKELTALGFAVDWNRLMN